MQRTKLVFRLSSLLAPVLIFIAPTSGFCSDEWEQSKRTAIEIEFPVTSQTVRVTNVVPTDYEGTIQSWETETTAGKATLSLSDAPLVIEELPAGPSVTPSLRQRGGRGLLYEDSPFGFYPRSFGMNADLSDWKKRCEDATYSGFR